MIRFVGWTKNKQTNPITSTKCRSCNYSCCKHSIVAKLSIHVSCFIQKIDSKPFLFQTVQFCPENRYTVSCLHIWHILLFMISWKTGRTECLGLGVKPGNLCVYFYKHIHQELQAVSEHCIATLKQRIKLHSCCGMW